MSKYSNFGSDSYYKTEQERKAREKFKPIKNTVAVVLAIFFFSLFLAFSTFVFFYWCFSVFSIHYAIKSLLAFLAAYFLLFLINPNTDLKSRVRNASRPGLAMALFASLLFGVAKYGAGPLDKYIKYRGTTNVVVVDSVAPDSGLKNVEEPYRFQ